jgi:hypothetical protein
VYPYVDGRTRGDSAQGVDVIQRFGTDMPHARKGLPKNGSLGGLTERVAEYQYRIGGLSWA